MPVYNTSTKHANQWHLSLAHYQNGNYQRAYDMASELRDAMNVMDMVPSVAKQPQHEEGGVQMCFTDSLDHLRKLIHICDKKLDFANSKKEHQSNMDLEGWTDYIDSPAFEMRLDTHLREAIITAHIEAARKCSGAANEWNLQRFVDMGLDVSECHFDDLIEAVRDQAKIVMFG